MDGTRQRRVAQDGGFQPPLRDLLQLIEDRVALGGGHLAQPAPRGAQPRALGTPSGLRSPTGWSWLAFGSLRESCARCARLATGGGPGSSAAVVEPSASRASANAAA